MVSETVYVVGRERVATARGLHRKGPGCHYVPYEKRVVDGYEWFGPFVGPGGANITRTKRGGMSHKEFVERAKENPEIANEWWKAQYVVREPGVYGDRVSDTGPHEQYKEWSYERGEWVWRIPFLVSPPPASGFLNKWDRDHTYGGRLGNDTAQRRSGAKDVDERRELVRLCGKLNEAEKKIADLASVVLEWQELASVVLEWQELAVARQREIDHVLSRNIYLSEKLDNALARLHRIASLSSPEKEK